MLLTVKVRVIYVKNKIYKRENSFEKSGIRPKKGTYYDFF